MSKTSPTIHDDATEHRTPFLFFKKSVRASKSNYLITQLRSPFSGHMMRFALSDLGNSTIVY